MTSRADVNHAMEHFTRGKLSESRFRGIVESFIREQRQRRDHTQPPGPQQRQRPQFGAGGSRQPTRGTNDATTAVFTDGSASPNPGPGGWCAVWVQNGTIVDERRGSEPHTTNNRMELQALIGAFKLLPANAQVDVISDSELCVNTITKWAPAWRAAGWRRKTGAIKNLDLVKELLSLAEAHPGCRLKWVRAHTGNRWNEYADRRANEARAEGR